MNSGASAMLSAMQKSAKMIPQDQYFRLKCKRKRRKNGFKVNTQNTPFNHFKVPNVSVSNHHDDVHEKECLIVEDPNKLLYEI